MGKRRPKKTPGARPESIRHLPLAERLRILAELLEAKHLQSLGLPEQAAPADDDEPASDAELATLREMWGDDGGIAMGRPPSSCPYCGGSVTGHAGRWECNSCDGEGSY